MKNDMTSIEGLKRLKALQEKYKNTQADFTIKKGFGFSEDTKAVDAIKKSISRIEDTIKWKDKIRKQ